jgi:hypothetical protein
VLGVRTIGVALAAATAAWLARSGRSAGRFTVRPEGHPYDRRVQLDAAARAMIATAPDAHCLVVDEGPGLSGSSLLAAGEALLGAGVPAERVLLFGTRAIDPATLVAPDAAARWGRFASAAAPAPAWLQPGERDLSGGAWRALATTDRSDWPAAWPAMERPKALATNGQVLRKWEGLGRHGDRVHDRAARLGDARWSPRPLSAPDARGFLRYEFLPGRPLGMNDRSPAIAANLGRYVATRGRLFPAEPSAGAQEAFAAMVQANVAFELGREVALPATPWQRPAIVDGRLMPHEWLAATNGRLVKTDAATHGDDQFFPGPTDVAWDLAGAIVEWELDASLRTPLLAAYAATAGEDAADRVPAFLIAYAAFRARYALMAAHACAPDDAERWRRLQLRYRGALVRALEESGSG